MQTWTQWQAEVVAMLSAEFEEILHRISIDDVDWPSWRNY
jgi:hypothetical protein